MEDKQLRTSLSRLLLAFAELQHAATMIDHFEEPEAKHTLRQLDQLTSQMEDLRMFIRHRV